MTSDLCLDWYPPFVIGIARNDISHAGEMPAVVPEMCASLDYEGFIGDL
jgi:hypothetical protein